MITKEHVRVALLAAMEKVAPATYLAWTKRQWSEKDELALETMARVLNEQVLK